MDGFINFFKETGIPSNKALAKVKGITRCRKAGFLGTLDPVASGVLPIAAGRATKLLPFFENSLKKYRATIIFGFETDTQDGTGNATRTGPAPGAGERKKLEETFARFTGEIKQLPPMYSAKKVNGQRLYRIARKGGEVKRDEKTVTVHSIKLEEFGGETAVFTAVVSKGTYVRTLCQDIGRAFGCPAHMGDLIREEAHNFAVKDSFTLKKLEENRDAAEKWLLPLDYPLMFMPGFNATPKEQNMLVNGMPVQWSGERTSLVRLYDKDGNFFGVGRVDAATRELIPEKIIPAGRGKKVTAQRSSNKY